MTKEEHQAAVHKAYLNGMEMGDKSGYRRGMKEGYNQGYSDGHRDGYQAGHLSQCSEPCKMKLSIPHINH